MFEIAVQRVEMQALARRTGATAAQRGATLKGIVLALAAGVLLGALVALPYEQMLGLPVAAWAILRSAVATAVLGGLCTIRARDLVFDARAMVAPADGTWTSESTSTDR